MNARELRHFFSQRCANVTMEIRELAYQMLAL
jgi:thymidylate synthase ThyX